MNPAQAVALVAAAVLLCPLAALTTVGQHRRGHGGWDSAIAGLCFPITWTAR